MVARGVLKRHRYVDLGDTKTLFVKLARKDGAGLYAVVEATNYGRKRNSGFSLTVDLAKMDDEQVVQDKMSEVETARLELGDAQMEDELTKKADIVED